MSTDMQAGNWLDGYQAVSPAPVEFIKGERQRYIDGRHINGAWSDPWWLYGPGRGWAVARRWRSKDQDGLEYRDGRYRLVHIPALEEREVAPWAPEPARELVTA